MSSEADRVKEVDDVERHATVPPVGVFAGVRVIVGPVETVEEIALPPGADPLDDLPAPPSGEDGTIAYTSASWNVNPDSLGNSYLDKLNKAVAPARKAGLTVDYGAGAGNIGQQTNDLTSEAIGLACAMGFALLGGLIGARRANRNR